MMVLNESESVDIRQLCLYLSGCRWQIALSVLFCVAVALIFLFFTRDIMTFRYRVMLAVDTPVTWTSCPTGSLQCKQDIVSRPFMRALPPGYREGMSFSSKDSSLGIQVTEKKANEQGVRRRLRAAEIQERQWYRAQSAHPSRSVPSDMMVTETWARLFLLTDSVAYAADFDEGELKIKQKYPPVLTLILAIFIGLITSAGYLLVRQSWGNGSTGSSCTEPVLQNKLFRQSENRE